MQQRWLVELKKSVQLGLRMGGAAGLLFGLGWNLVWIVPGIMFTVAEWRFIEWVTMMHAEGFFLKAAQMSLGIFLAAGITFFLLGCLLYFFEKLEKKPGETGV